MAARPLESGDADALTGPTATGFAKLPGAEAAAGVLDFSGRRAVHEAGHIVTGHLLALGVSGATIDGQAATFFGESRIAETAETIDLTAQLQTLMPGLSQSRDDVAVDLLRCVDNVVCLMAGIEAERLCCGSALPNEHDRAEAEAIAGLVVRSRSPAAIAAFVRFAEIEARALLADHLDSVRAIAGALLKRRTTLDADEIAAIMRQVAGSPTVS